MDFARGQGKLTVALLLVSFLSVVTVGCYYDSVEGLHPINGYTDPCDSSQQAVYSQAIHSIISYNCISCHNSSYASAGVVLETYDEVRHYTENGMIMNAVERKPGANPMPPTLALPSCQIEKLNAWIVNNYPE